MRLRFCLTMKYLDKARSSFHRTFGTRRQHLVYEPILRFRCLLFSEIRRERSTLTPRSSKNEFRRVERIANSRWVIRLANSGNTFRELSYPSAERPSSLEIACAWNLLGRGVGRRNSYCRSRPSNSLQWDRAPLSARTVARGSRNIRWSRTCRH